MVPKPIRDDLPAVLDGPSVKGCRQPFPIWDANILQVDMPMPASDSAGLLEPKLKRAVNGSASDTSGGQISCRATAVPASVRRRRRLWRPPVDLVAYQQLPVVL